MQSLNSMRLLMLSLNIGQPHSVKFDSWNGLNSEGIDSLIPTTMNTTIPLYKFLFSPTLTYYPDRQSGDFCKYMSSAIKIMSQEKKPFSWTVFNHFNASAPLVEFHLTMAKTGLEITCSLGGTYNLNVRHAKSLILSILVFHAIYKSFFDQVHSGVHCSCQWHYFVYTLRSFLNNILFSMLPSLWPWINQKLNGELIHNYLIF